MALADAPSWARGERDAASRQGGEGDALARDRLEEVLERICRALARQHHGDALELIAAQAHSTRQACWWCGQRRGRPLSLEGIEESSPQRHTAHPQRARREADAARQLCVGCRFAPRATRAVLG